MNSERVELFEPLYVMNMKVTFRTFESGAGDCIFLVIKDGVDDSCFHIMIDCNVLTDEIKNFIKDDLGKCIDVMIVTHIDRDHANGITKLLRNPEFADMQIGKILFNGFQPQSDHPQILEAQVVDKLEAVADLLPPTLDKYFQKTNGMDAACLITELNKHPQWKKVWRQTPILAGEIISLGDNEKWGRLRVLSPSQEAIDDLLYEVKLEYARRLGEAPPKEDFLNQDKYFELMLRLSELRKRPQKARKTGTLTLNKDLLERWSKIDAEESDVTCANKASLAFCWEGGEEPKRILLMGDAVSSQVITQLDEIDKYRIWFEAVKVAHHGSKHNTSISLNNRVDSAHYFFTGGKKSEGPHVETVAKIILKSISEGNYFREIHFNHEKEISLWKELKKEEMTQLLNYYHFQLNTNNIYEFEY